MDVYALITIITLSLATFSCGICVGVLMENRRRRLENDYHLYIEESLLRLETLMDEGIEETDRSILRLKSEIRYTQGYLSRLTVDEDYMITSPGVTPTMAFSYEDVEDDDELLRDE